MRANWPERLGTPPADLLTGVPAYVDGRMLAITEAAGGAVVNRDRMWHYVEGVRNWDPVWPGHAIRILPGPSSMWFDGARQPAAGALPPRLRHARHAGPLAAHRFRPLLVRAQPVARRQGVRAVRVGAEPRPHRSGATATSSGGPITKVTPSVQAFLDHGEDWLTADTISELVAKMNALTPEAPLDPAHIERQIVERDRQVDNAYTKDAQVAAIRVARRYRGDRLTKRAHPLHRILDPKHGPARRGAAAGAVAQDARRPAHRPARPGARAVGRAGAGAVRRG